MTDNINWRKDEPGYSVKKAPQIIEIPAQNYFEIDGIGDPNQADFQARIQALYPVSYKIRMSQKNDWDIPGFKLYTVYPLEGFWGLQEKYLNEPVMKKEHFQYTIKIKQPDFVTDEIAELALQKAQDKVDEKLLSQVRFVHEPAQLAAQILHIGSFDTENESFEKLETFIDKQGYQRTQKEHTEIYMSDFRRVAEEKRKTILRVAIAPK